VSPLLPPHIGCQFRGFIAQLGLFETLSAAGKFSVPRVDACTFCRRVILALYALYGIPVVNEFIVLYTAV